MQSKIFKGVLALLLSIALILCFTTQSAMASRQSEIQLLADQFLLSPMNHASFDNHCEMVLADMESFDFDIQSDEVLLEYVSTLSDAEARALSRSMLRFRRVFRRVGRFVRKAGGVLKKVAKVALPIAATVFTGGIGGALAGSLAGSLGSVGGALVKGATLLSKAGAIVGKGQTILGGLNAVTGGKSKLLNKGLGFLNKVSGVVGKGQMFLGRGTDIISGLKGLTNVNLKGLASQFKPSELLKGANVFQKGQNFLGKASQLVGKGQEIFQNLNQITGGKSKFINKGLNILGKAQTFTGVGTDALNGIQGGVNSLKNLKNLKGADLKKFLTLDGLQNGIGKVQGSLTKGQDFLGKINELTGGKSKKLNKLIQTLGKGQTILGRGSDIVGGVNGVKTTIQNMDSNLFKNFFLKNEKGNVAVNPEGVKHFLGKVQTVLGTGSSLLENLNKVTGGKAEFINKAMEVIQKGQQGVAKGQEGVEKVEQFLNTENPLDKATQVWDAVQQIAGSMNQPNVEQTAQPDVPVENAAAASG